MGRVDGKVALVTGAARGQGRSHAVLLAEEGADVIALDLCGEIAGVGYPAASEEDLAETAQQVEAAGRRCFSRVADVRDAEVMGAVVAAGVAELGRLDIIAANAGIGSSPVPAVELEPSLWSQMIDTTLTGAWNTCRAGAPFIVEGGRGGAIVITSSAAALQAYANIAHYVSAKHGLVGLTRTLAVELGPHSIRVNNLAPTQVATPMILNDETYKLFVPDKDHPTRDDFAAVSQQMHLLPTPWVEPIDVSRALLFLVSDDARFITAITLPVDAGVTQH
ncbi:MAG: mycofactocin-coupled SDR family oxidoreductase [Actinobacteria bacterium]|nr:mycofactocin-coupled SDR family oxidoreductase [Actinomycetota bacterium]